MDPEDSDIDLNDSHDEDSDEWAPDQKKSSENEENEPLFNARNQSGNR